MGEQRRTGRTDSDPTTTQRLTVHDAARHLGISEDAVRMRVKRGTLPSEREGGRLYVLLTPDPTSDQTTDRLYEQMQERIAYLEGQVAEEREARRRADTLLARLMDRVPELPAPQETPPDAPGPPETGSEEPEQAPPRSDAPGPQSGTLRGLRRRIFGW